MDSLSQLSSREKEFTLKTFIAIDASVGQQIFVNEWFTTIDSMNLFIYFFFWEMEFT